jgi:hypothetical protein
MHSQNQPVIINDTTFHQLLQAASDTKRGIPVKDARTGSEGFIVSKEQYQELTESDMRDDTTLFAFMDDLHKKNADLDPDEVEDKVLRATMAVRYGTPHP